MKNISNPPIGNFSDPPGGNFGETDMDGFPGESEHRGFTSEIDGGG